MTFSVRDALNAGLMIGTPDDARGVPSRSGKPSNYDKYRKTMFRWRAAVELARAVYPDVTTGIYTPDEISDGSFVNRLTTRRTLPSTAARGSPRQMLASAAAVYGPTPGSS